MKAKRDLFTETEHWTEDANILARELNRVMTPIIEKYVGKGFRTRDIETVVNNETFTIMAGIRIDQDIERTKKKK